MKLEVLLFRGAHPERIHALREGYHTRALCGVWSYGTPRVWIGRLAEVDCRRCLGSLRAQYRERQAAVEQRLAGRGGVQMDISEQRRAQ